jgi:hypothetical protein
MGVNIEEIARSRIEMEQPLAGGLAVSAMSTGAVAASTLAPRLFPP